MDFVDTFPAQCQSSREGTFQQTVIKTWLFPDFMGGERKKGEMSVWRPCNHGGSVLHWVPPCPQSKHTAEPARALQSSLSWTWLLGLAVELEEEEVAVGNATEREKRAVQRWDTEHDLKLPCRTRQQRVPSA